MDFAINNYLPGVQTIYNDLAKLEQQLNPFVAFQYNLRRLKKSDIPYFHIQLSGNDLRFFHEVEQEVRRDSGYINPELKKWRKAKMSYNGKKYDIEIRIRGQQRLHAVRYKKSYKVKILNNENINGVKTFNFILPEDRLYYLATLAYYLADELQAPAPDSDFVNLFFNGRIQGIYFFMEDLNKEFLEHHGFQGSSFFTTSDDLFFSRLSDAGRNELQTYTNKQNDFYALKLKDAQYFLEFLQALKEKDFPLVYEKIDIKEVAKFAAIVTLYQDSHMGGANVKYYLDGTTGKIIPIIWDINLGSDETIYSNIGFDKQFLDSRRDKTGPDDIISLFLLNPYFLQLRNEYLYQLVNTDLITNYINKASNRFDSLFMMDTNGFYSYRRTKWFLDRYKRLIQNNAGILKDILQFNEIYITSHYNANRIDVDVSPHSLSQVRLNAIKFDNISMVKTNAKLIINHLDGKRDVISINESGHSFTISLDDILIYPYLDESYVLEHPKLTLSIMGVEFNEISVDNIRLEMTNDISSIPISQEEIKYEITAYYTKAIILNEEHLKKNKIRYLLRDNHLVIYPGTYLFKETYRIPEDFRVTIEGGTTLFLGPNVSLIFGNSLSINGSATQPVVIKNQIQGKPFGSFAVIGQLDSAVSVAFLNLSGGSEDYVDGAYFSGAFSVYHVDKTTIRNSVFYNNHADDGLNIKYSQVSIKDNVFSNNYVDQVDLDFCNGIVSNNQFISPQIKNDNGDGLDISGSVILAEDNLFDGFGDKGISIGEESKIYVIDSVMRNNNLGAAVKDNSTAYFYNNQWINNDINISAYKKKDIFNGGTIILDRESIISESDVNLDEKSQIKIESIDEKIEEIYNEF